MTRVDRHRTGAGWGCRKSNRACVRFASDFYGAAAQVLPILLLAITVEWRGVPPFARAFARCRMSRLGSLFERPLAVCC